MTQPAVAVADWGTTRLRVWLLDAAGGVIAERRSDEGLLAAQPDRFAEILQRNLDEMQAPADLPVVICGMAGSRQGWIEVPYFSVPASLETIFDAAARVPGGGRDIRILPGLAQRDAARPDVMRGEETQLAGAAAELGPARAVVCLPGTHSKWVELEAGRVISFQTFMTGELFSVLTAHSILGHSTGRSPAVSGASPAFAKSCRAALDDPFSLAKSLFAVRAATLLHDVQPTDAAAGLSGLLIGAEIAAATARYAPPSGKVVLVASGVLHDLYASALEIAGLAVTTIDADRAVRAGLAQAARHTAEDAA